MRTAFPFVPPACGFPCSDSEAMCWLRGVELPLPGEMQHLSGFPLHSFLPEITSPACVSGFLEAPASWVSGPRCAVGTGGGWSGLPASLPDLQHPSRAAGSGAGQGLLRLACAGSLHHLVILCHGVFLTPPAIPRGACRAGRGSPAPDSLPSAGQP